MDTRSTYERLRSIYGIAADRWCIARRDYELGRSDEAEYYAAKNAKDDAYDAMMSARGTEALS